MSLYGTGIVLLLAAGSIAAQTDPAPAQQNDPNRPTLFIIGDLPSGAIHDTLDPNRLKLVDSLSEGKTIRAYINSGAWDQVTAQFKAGDFVLIGFKANTDVSPSKLGSDASAAANSTFDGGGNATFDYMDPDTHLLEHIHSYGWYLSKLITDSIQQGAKPIVTYPPTPVDPTNCCPDNPSLAYPAWIISATAHQQSVPFLNLTAAGKGFRHGLEALRPDPLAAFLRPKEE